jgi:hypothetical protein
LRVATLIKLRVATLIKLRVVAGKQQKKDSVSISLLFFNFPATYY